MSRKYKFWESDKMYFISFAVINWIDVFIRDEYRNEIIECWKYCQENKGLEIFAWCIMPSHVHMVISSNTNSLSGIVRDMKSFTSTCIRECISNNKKESRREWMLWMMKRAGARNSNNKDWQFWQQHNQPIEINDQQHFASTVNYIHQNPVAAGFVHEPEHWIYSSACGFQNNNGLIKLETI